MQKHTIVPAEKFSTEDDHRGSGKMVASCQVWVAETRKRIKENKATIMTKKQHDAISYAFFLQKK
jgi:hypothetical protein